MEIKGYRIEKVIGRGGMATVYLAIQTALERHVALKVMNPAFANDLEFTTRFLQEGPIAARLNDPQIVTVYDSGVDEKHYYLAMEYLPGGTLKQKIRDGLPVEKTLTIIKLMGKGLAYAHSQGVLHRDIKPQNILFRASGEPVLTDFGIAKALTAASHLTVPGTAFGSPKYMSPEQAKGRTLDQRSDLYSLGVVFYEMLTGKPPFESKDAINLAQMHITEPVPPMPPQYVLFQALFDRLLAKNPSKRFQSADEFLTALKDVRQHYLLDVSLSSAGPTGTAPGSDADQPDATQVRLPKRTTATSERTLPPASQRSGLAKLFVGLTVLVIAGVGGGYIYLNYGTDKTAPISATDPLSNEREGLQQALAKAEQLQQQGQYEEGLQTVRAALSEAPDHPRLLLLQTELENALQAESASTVEQTPEQSPQQTAQNEAEQQLTATLGQARQLRRQGELEQSLALVQETLTRYPDNADLLGLQQELQATIDDLERRRQSASFLATAQHALQENNLDASRQALEQGLALMPEHQELLALRDQIEARQAALDNERQAAELYQHAQQALQQEQLDTALGNIEQALQLLPQDEQLTTLHTRIQERIRAVQEQAEMERQLRQQIEQLLAQAQKQIDQLQLSTPPGDNAQETYRQVLAQDPENQAALAGLREIAARYHELAEQALASSESDKALGYLERGLSIQPDTPALVSLQEQIQTDQAVRTQLTLARDKLAQEQLEDSLKAVDDGLQIAPENTDLHGLRAEILHRLDQRERRLIATTALTEAQALRQQNQLEQALSVVANALQEVPDDPDLAVLQQELQDEQALQQRQAAAAERLAIAQQALERAELSEAYTQVQQGLGQLSDDPALLQLKQEIERRQALVALHAKAEELIQNNELDSALTLVQQGFELAPDDPQLLALQERIQQAQLAAAQTPAPDAVTLGEGLASLAQQIGLQDVEGFLRQRVDQLATAPGQDQTATTEPDDTPEASSENTAELTTAESPEQEIPNDDTTTTPADSTQAESPQTAAVSTDPEVAPGVAPNAAPDTIENSKNTESPEDTAEDETTTQEQQIAELLATAEQHIEQLNLTTPKGKNAYEVYRQILTLDPDNSAARKGLQTIVSRYRGWAQKQRDRGNFQRSLNNIEKALRVDPDNTELLALRQTVQDEQQAARRSSTPPPRTTEPASSDPCAIDRGSKECWCKTLKMFCD